MKRSLRILVVDDDADNANSLGELFELEGHRPLVVYDGGAAIAAYLKEDFDIAFMDVMMPGKNGVESFLEIKKLKPLAKVYMMTGYSVEQLLQQAMAGGAMGVFSKPVTFTPAGGKPTQILRFKVTILSFLSDADKNALVAKLQQ